ncbi:hypothetical protein HY26_17535 [Hyphomonas sp. GM-8P]|nr:hypothetical protein HY26_17535 [Hyphomonas sp. GM-8P]
MRCNSIIFRHDGSFKTDNLAIRPMYMRTIISFMGMLVIRVVMMGFMFIVFYDPTFSQHPAFASFCIFDSHAIHRI